MFCIEHFDIILNKEPPERPIQPHELERRLTNEHQCLVNFEYVKLCSE